MDLDAEAAVRRLAAERGAATIDDERKRTVQAAYDSLGPRFGEWGERVEGDPWKRFLEDLAARLPEGGCVLDLGCGNGAKIACLGERFHLVAVDLSEEQLRLARARVPEATLVAGDFGELDFAAETFDAVTAFYSIMHVPREEHRALFARIARWLKPGGLFLASLSHVGGADWTGEWLGVEMFFSGFDAETNRRLLREAGLELVLDELVWMREPQGEVAFLWVLARKPA
ncbi:MAG TPA: class I SAM-dependent methyltransferase [Gaiellaceae bacterium]|nr:class I SAM-dependent methyltransferase [Gaiellaceae bacterium]